jgi:uracil-DNA glycosylase family 4
MKQKEGSSISSSPPFDLEKFARELIACRRCGRLADHCQKTSLVKVRRFRTESYWGRPVPSFGPSDATLMIVGLAPAAHGGNRTGRVFTGDSSGDFLFSALHRFGFANQPESRSRDDGLVLYRTYITAILHCAPPDNKPLPGEILNCRSFLIREIRGLKKIKAVLTLGRIAFEQYLGSLTAIGLLDHSRGFRFLHGASYRLGDRLPLLFSSYHPSQQNTRTGKLTPKMFDDVLSAIRKYLDETPAGSLQVKAECATQ